MTMTFGTKPTRPVDLVIAAYVHLRGVDRAELLDGVTTTREISLLRHELMYLLGDMTYLPRADIGRWVGGRSEATVKEGMARIADRIVADAAYRDQLQLLRAAILSHVVMQPPVRPQTARDIARRVASRPDDYPEDTRALAIALLSVDHMLSLREMEAEDCLLCAQAVIRDMRGVA